MSNLHAAGLVTSDTFAFAVVAAVLADGAEWALDDMPTVVEAPPDDDDLERLIEGLCAL